MFQELSKPEESWGPATREHHEEFIRNIASSEKLKMEREQGLFQNDVALVKKIGRAVSKESGLNIIVQADTSKLGIRNVGTSAISVTRSCLEVPTSRIALLGNEEKATKDTTTHSIPAYLNTENSPDSENPITVNFPANDD